MPELNAIHHPALPVAITVAAFLHSSVGQSEATGDLATAALSGLTSAEPTPGARLPGALRCKPLEQPFCCSDQPCRSMTTISSGPPTPIQHEP